MKTYLIEIKSKCEAPDYCDEVEARERVEAVRIFTGRINRRSEEVWSEEEVAKHVFCLTEKGIIYGART